jgi:ferrous iron transport protein A
MNLSNFQPGMTATIKGFDHCNRYYKQKLLAMGLVPGTQVTITKYSPFNDLIELMIDNFSLILRKSEAEILKINKVNM